METTCVACGVQSTGMINLFLHPLNLDVIFSEVTGIAKIFSNDALCILCYDELKAAHNFRKKCRQFQETRNNNSPSRISLPIRAPPTLVETVEKPETAISSTIEDIKDTAQEVVSNDDNPEDFSEPIEETADDIAMSHQEMDNDSNEEPENEIVSDELVKDEEPPVKLEEQSDDFSASTEPPLEVAVTTRQTVRVYRKKRCKNPELDIFTGILPTTCECCFKEFHNIKEKETHTKIHTKEEKPFCCKQIGCQSRFKDRAGVRNHYRIHIEGKKFTCSMCHQSFNQKGNLTVHERMHLGEKPFVCPTCGKGFTESGNLKTHIRHHTDERPYQCGFCEKKFRTHYSHKIHERSHTGDRPFGCEMCSKSFYSTGKLQNHRRIHTGERPYLCQVEGCKAAFVESNGLRRHLKVHAKQIVSDESTTVQRKEPKRNSRKSIPIIY